MHSSGVTMQGTGVGDMKRRSSFPPVHKPLSKKRASFTNIEQFFLHSLLVDTKLNENSNDENEHDIENECPSSISENDGNVTHDTDEADWNLMKRLLHIDRKKHLLNDDILFSLPFEDRNMKTFSSVNYCANDDNFLPETKPKPPIQANRDNSLHVELWRAHEEGISLSQLKNQSNLTTAATSIRKIDKDDKIGPLTLTELIQELNQINTRNETKNESHHQILKDISDREDDTVLSDTEVRPPKVRGIISSKKSFDDDESTASSWGSSDGGFDNYDAWNVLKDEYAKDFGFDYNEVRMKPSKSCYKNEENVNDELDNREYDEEAQVTTFKILGTSADDKNSHPHVLSPPLMESLLSFLPETFSGEHFWLKFSLLRDGASMDTLCRYVRATPNTILAIETTNGDVFGSFTSSTWERGKSLDHVYGNNGYYGGGQTFLWRMRHNRVRTPCYSLFDQAQLESEIDVYMWSGLNDYIQLCTKDRIALGGGQLPIHPNTLDATTLDEKPHSQQEEIDEEHNITKAETAVCKESKKTSSCVNDSDECTNNGFGLAINNDLLHGTSSPCATFLNPSLSNHSSKGEAFDIANLELWTLTPCRTVDEAEKLEMKKYFIKENVASSSSVDSKSRNSSTRFGSSRVNFGSQKFNDSEKMFSSSSSSTAMTNSFSYTTSKNNLRFDAADLSQDKFYRRVGENDDNEFDRQAWAYERTVFPF